MFAHFWTLSPVLQLCNICIHFQPHLVTFSHFYPIVATVEILRHILVSSSRLPILTTFCSTLYNFHHFYLLLISFSTFHHFLNCHNFWAFFTTFEPVWSPSSLFWPLFAALCQSFAFSSAFCQLIPFFARIDHFWPRLDFTLLFHSFQFLCHLYLRFITFPLFANFAIFWQFFLPLAL